MDAMLQELDGAVVLVTPRGTLVFSAVEASRLGYDMAECARFLHSKESDDPARHRRTPYRLVTVIDPAPVPEQGDTAPPDMKGQLAVEPDLVSTGVGITAGSPP
jgi:hypothetical protein